MESYNSEYNKLINKLKATRTKENLIDFSTALFNTLILIISSIFLVSIIETIANGDLTFRTILFGFVVVMSVLGVGFFILPSLARMFGFTYNPSIYEMALRIGGKYPDIKDKFSNVLQLLPIKSESSANTSNQLAEAAFNEISSEIRDRNFDIIIDKKRLNRSLILFLLSAILFISPLFIFQNTLGEGFYRVQNFRQSFIPPVPFELSIEPLEKDVLRGDDVLVRVNATGEIPSEVTLHLKEQQQKEFDKYTLKYNVDEAAFIYKITSIKNPVEFYAEASWMNTSVVTDIGKVSITDFPVIRSISGILRFPPYTNLAPRGFNEQNGDISALVGSNADFTVIANKDITKAEINFVSVQTIDSTGTQIQDTIIIPLDIEDRKLTGRMTVRKSGEYFIKIYDLEGNSNTNPISYNVIAMTDAYPTISLLEPLGNVELSKDGILPIKVNISDDYGFAHLKLFYKLTESKYAQPEEEYRSTEIFLPKNSTVLEVPYVWDLNELYITPGEKYEFYLEVADNDIVNGPKTDKTKVISIKLPSMDELYSEAEQNQEKIQEELEKVLKETQELQKNIEELNRDLKQKERKEELNWDEKKKAENIMKKQEELKEKFDDLQKKLEDTTEKLQDNNLMSQETMEKFMELQKLMKEVNSEDLQKYQKQVQETLDQMTPEQLQKAMEKFKFDEDQFNKSIERTMKLLKRLQAEQKMDALSKKAEELANKQDELQKQMENANLNDQQKKDELSQKQDALANEMDSIKKDMDSLKEKMNEIGDDNLPMEEMQNAEQTLNSEQTKQEMQNASQQMQQNNKSEAQKSQQKASKNLRDFAQKMQNMKQQMSNSVSQEAIRQMQKSINDMVELSKKQEQLKDIAENADNYSTQVPQLNKDQANLSEALTNLANELAELSQKSMAITPQMGQEIGNAMQKMRSAMNNMAERRMRSAAKEQGEAMASMNRAASMMQEMMGNMQGQGQGQGSGGMGQGQQKPGEGGMSFSERMQQLAAQQQQINQSLQQMMQQGQGGSKMSQEKRAQMGRLSDKQGKAQKSLEELAKEQKEAGSQGEKKALGDLEKIKEDMKEVLSDMQSGNVNEETLQKQDKILSRLLDATRSINQRDFEKKREGKTGKNYDLTGPEEIDLKSEKAKEVLMKELMNSLRQGYTKDYQLLIKQYFDALSTSEKEPVQ